ncbi:hypothetical protein V5E97_05135 [Singulisphaera sp. Ch08]|uniref:Uncharacterized protein n=1 Tax=Singulisphaera sp. Ch08 TaxID=3120278 RepID=A0AAU7CJY9_9BACT
MRIPHVRFSVRIMLVAVAIVGIFSAIGAKMKRDSEARLRYLVFNATLQAETEMGDLSAFDVTYQWTGDYCAQVIFRPKEGKKKEGRSYQVDSCCCGMKMKVKSSPLP